MNAASPFPFEPSAPPAYQPAPGPQPARGALPYGLLRQTHPPSPPHDRGYDAKVWAELDDLYRGGYQILEHAAQYIQRALGEPDARYKERLHLAAYIGYFGQIVNVYTAALFRGQVAVIPASDAEDTETPGELPDRATYEAFSKDADLRGTSFGQVLKQAATAALVKGKALVAVDFPATDEAPQTRADSDSLGVARPYAYCLEPEEMIDWEYESEVRRQVDLGAGRSVEFTVGRFSWCILRRVVRHRAAPEQARGAPVEEFRVWRKRPDGVVVWEIYRTQPLKDGQAIKDTDLVPLVDTGETRFLEIPLVEVRLPETLWLGNIIGPLNLEHWRRRSALLAAQQRSLLVVPTVYLGPQDGGFRQPLPPDIQQDPARGDDPVARYTAQGYLVLGHQDKLAFEGPPTDAFGIVDKELKDLVDEIHRVSGRMAASVSSTSTAAGRSGASKAQDNKDFVTVVCALAAIMSDAARHVYTVISDARGEAVMWTVHGLDGCEDDEDRTVLLEEALQADAIAIPSATFRTEFRTRTALRLLPGLSPETQETIRAEIKKAGVAEETQPPPEELPTRPESNEQQVA